MEDILTAVAVVAGLVSAGCWLRSSFAKVTHEQAMERRKRAAKKAGVEPNLASISYNGLDPYETLALQSRWNAAGAIFAATAVATQALAPVV